MKEWMAQADPPKEASTFERVNDRSQLLSSNGMRHYFKELKTASGVLKKKICIDNRWGFEKIFTMKNGMAASAFGHLSMYFSKRFCNYFCGINRHL